MADSRFQQLQEQLESVGKGEVIRTLEAAVDRGNAHASAFLEELEQSLLGFRNAGDIWRQLIASAEQYLCRQPQLAPSSGFVRVISAIDFLCYYSKKFIKVEEVTRRGSVRAEIDKIKAAFPMVTVDNLQLFMEDFLNLNGRLRRRGYALWLTPDVDVADCSTFADYAKKLALGDATEKPGFRFAIGSQHVGSTPNVRRGEPDHDPSQSMTIHEPTIVDGMWHEKFVEGGLTSGGVTEYVSKLDNTEAIDRLEMIE